ncbi:unnamed protein product [Spodoptera exigua]|nr:unnamed protein product [Spodoptera exigua]
MAAQRLKSLLLMHEGVGSKPGNHGDLVGPLAGSQGRVWSERLWTELTKILNAVGGGVSKITDKWKKCDHGAQDHAVTQHCTSYYKQAPPPLPLEPTQTSVQGRQSVTPTPPATPAPVPRPPPPARSPPNPGSAHYFEAKAATFQPRVCNFSIYQASSAAAGSLSGYLELEEARLGYNTSKICEHWRARIESMFYISLKEEEDLKIIGINSRAKPGVIAIYGDEDETDAEIENIVEEFHDNKSLPSALYRTPSTPEVDITPQAEVSPAIPDVRESHHIFQSQVITSPKIYV